MTQNLSLALDILAAIITVVYLLKLCVDLKRGGGAGEIVFNNPFPSKRSLLNQHVISRIG